MPNPWDPPWQPNWSDVRFDPAVAQNAITALLATAAEIEAATKERSDLANVARQHWQGRYRNEFDQRFDGTVRGAVQLVADLRQAAANLQHAMAQAAQDQQTRMQQRGVWIQQEADNHREWLHQQELQQQQQLAALAASGYTP